MDKIVSLSRRRGFVFPSSEIYGGLGSTYDYGHYGVLTKNNIRQLWFRSMIQEREDMVALDSAVILNPAVWEASGHVAGFSDPLVDCRTCKLRFRADKLDDAQCGKKPSKKPGEYSECDLTQARQFNLMFQTQVGAMEDASSTAFLRPETAQGIFINFKNVMQLARRKPPFGIAQTGKSFRNEITPGNFLFRVREFEQMEMEYFVPPDEGEKWYRYWIDERLNWYLLYGLRQSKLRVREHGPEERSHYSQGTSDIEYEYPIGWGELEGIANRGDFDLTQHAEHARTKTTARSGAATAARTRSARPGRLPSTSRPSRTTLSRCATAILSRRNAFRSPASATGSRMRSSGTGSRRRGVRRCAACAA